MGSMNFAPIPWQRGSRKWKYDWEEQYLLSSDQNIFRNTFRDIEKISSSWGGHGTSSSTNATTPGTFTILPLRRSRHVQAADLSPADLRHSRRHRHRFRESMFMKRTADKLFGNDYHWSVLGRVVSDPVRDSGRDDGRQLRVGLEDASISVAGNWQRQRGTGREDAPHHRGSRYQIATPKGRARSADLKGADRVKF